MFDILCKNNELKLCDNMDIKYLSAHSSDLIFQNPT